MTANVFPATIGWKTVCRTIAAMVYIVLLFVLAVAIAAPFFGVDTRRSGDWVRRPDDRF